MRFLTTVIVAFVATTGIARAQTPQTSIPSPAVQAPATQEGPLQLPATVCGLEVPAPAALPPVGTTPEMCINLFCFEKQGGIPVVDPETCLYYVVLKNHVSVPSQKKWVPWSEAIEQIILADFRRLWATNFLDDLS